MVLNEIVERISLEPLLFLLLTITFINIIFLVRVISGGNGNDITRLSDTYVDDPTNTTLLQEEVVKGPDSDQIDKQGLSASQNTEPVESSIRTPTVSNKVETLNCEYCKIFKNLNTAVCPNCGSLLNLSPQLDKIKAV